jgi:hypothetical protein
VRAELIGEQPQRGVVCRHRADPTDHEQR